MTDLIRKRLILEAVRSQIYKYGMGKTKHRPNSERWLELDHAEKSYRELLDILNSEMRGTV